MGSKKYHEGCQEKALPRNEKNIIIKSELYFAKEKSSWGRGGVAFIKPLSGICNHNFSFENIDDNACVMVLKKEYTYGKMFLISQNQFVDVIRQENDIDGRIDVDLDEVIHSGSKQILDNAWYDSLIFLGYDEGYPVFTFSHHSFLKEELNVPHANYMKCLNAGLKQAYGFSDNEIIQYLKKRQPCC